MTRTIVLILMVMGLTNCKTTQKTITNSNPDIAAPGTRTPAGGCTGMYCPVGGAVNGTGTSSIVY